MTSNSELDALRARIAALEAALAPLVALAGAIRDDAAKATPGPWAVVQRDHFTFIKEAKWVNSYDVDHLARVFASKPNARLIAAAPDMAAAILAAADAAGG